MMEPSEEILKALDEIVDVNLEEVGKRRVRKRSSILKQPRIDDDQTEDPQKRKSFTSKRRVSFADKFQVMELCTGNVYDIPGRNASASDSTLNGDPKSGFKQETSNKVVSDSYISRSEIKVSEISEVILIESERNSSLQFSKKHKISSDKNAEPENKKIHIHEKNSSPLNEEENVFKNVENCMSEFNKFLFAGVDINNKEKDENLKSTVVTNLSATQDDFQQKSIEEKLRELTNDITMSKPENLHLNYKSVSSSMHIVNNYDFRSESILGNKSDINLENRMDPKRWISKVEVLPISFSEMPLEENKENIFVDVKNKNVLVTNVRDLKLKEKVPLKISHASKPLSFGSQIHPPNSFSASKSVQDNKDFDPEKQNVKSLANMTCASAHSMELTCVPPDLSDTSKQSMDDGFIENDQDNFNKTCIDSSIFMDLTCNVQSAEFTENDKSVNMAEDNMEITCDDHYNLSDCLLISSENNCLKNPSILCAEFSNDKKGENIDSVDKCSQTKYFSSYGMEITCNVKDNTNLNICYQVEHPKIDSQINEQSQSLKICLSNNTVNNFDDDDHCKGISEDASIHCSTKSVLTTDPVLLESEEVISSHHLENDKAMCDEMELTCYDRTISEDNVCDASTNHIYAMNSKDAQVSDEELSENEYEIQQVKVVNSEFENLKSSMPLEKLNPTKNQTELGNLSNTAYISDVNSKSLSNNRTLHFSSDYMELTSRTSSEELNNKNNVSSENFMKTKHYSSFEMDFTCNSVSNAKSVHGKRQVESQDEILDENNYCTNKSHPAKHKKLEFSFDCGTQFHYDTSHQLDCTKEKKDSSVTSKTDLIDNTPTKSINQFQKFSNTKYFSSLEMDLTCNNVPSDFKEQCLSENDKIFTSKNISKDRISYSNKESSSISKKMSDDEIMMASETDLNDYVSKNVNPLKHASETKHFESIDMTLTCKVSSNYKSKYFSDNDVFTDNNNSSNRNQSMNKVNSSASENSNIIDKEKHSQNLPKSAFSSSKNHSHFVNNVNYLTSDIPKSASDIYLVNDGENPDFQNLHKTKYFSCGMELTCGPQNGTESCFELVPNSSSDSVFSYECRNNIANKSVSKIAEDSKLVESQNKEKSKIEKEVIENSFINSNVIAVIADKKLDSNCDLLNKPSSSFSKQNVNIIDSANSNFQKQNMDSQNSLETFNVVQSMHEANENPEFLKRPGILNKDNEFELDNKVMKISNPLEPGIVYAIKQVKGVNQASPKDYNMFKFPEIFFPLKTKPKATASCSRIQLTKAVREAIRKSCSFNYVQNECSPEFSEMNTLSKSKRSLKLNKSPAKMNARSTSQSLNSNMLPDAPYSPQIFETWKSKTKTVTETVHVYPDNNTPLSKANMSINKIGSLKKDVSSTSNVSPDTMNCLRRSIDFENEINSSGIIISHVREESIIEKTGVIATCIEDAFPDSSKFCLDSSISLVPNDDSFGSENLKLNFETLKEFNSTSFLNSSFDQLKTISLQGVDAHNSKDSAVKISRISNPNLSKEYMHQELVTKKSKCDDSISKSTLIPQSNCNIQDHLPNKNITLLKQNNTNQITEYNKTQLNEEIKRNDYECHIMSSNLMSSETDKDCSHIFREKENPSKLNECINKVQIKKVQESSEIHEQISNATSIQTFSKELNKAGDNKLSVLKQKIPTNKNQNEKTKEVNTLTNEFSETINEGADLINCNKARLSINNECVSKGNVKSVANENKLSSPSETCKNLDDLCLPSSSELQKGNAQNVCHRSLLEGSIHDKLHQQYSSLEVEPIKKDEDRNNKSKLHEDYLNDINTSNKLHNSEKQNDQISIKPKNGKQCPVNSERSNYVMENIENQESDKCDLSRNLENKKLLAGQSINLIKQNVTSIVLSKSPTKLNENEVISNNMTTDLGRTCSDTIADDNFLDDNSSNADQCIEASTVLQGHLQQNNMYFENPFEKIHSLRKEFIEASECENCLWCLKEMDDNQAAFEILGDRLFACYLMCVNLDFSSDIGLCTQIGFIHLKEEPDDTDELGFSLFQSLTTKAIQQLPFPAHELLNVLPKIVNFALSAECLIKDVWRIRIHNEIFIDLKTPNKHPLLIQTPKLDIKILNENHFSCFNISLPINLTSYPNEKIHPEVTHLEHNITDKEIIIDAITKINPGKNYLSRISEAANAL